MVDSLGLKNTILYKTLIEWVSSESVGSVLHLILLYAPFVVGTIEDYTQGIYKCQLSSRPSKMLY